MWLQYHSQSVNTFNSNVNSIGYQIGLAQLLGLLTNNVGVMSIEIDNSTEWL